MTLQFNIVAYTRTFARPLQTAAGRIDARQGFILQLQEDGQIIAQGECAPLPLFSKESLADCLAEARTWKAAATDGVDAWLARADTLGHLPALRCAVETLAIQLSSARARPLSDEQWPAPARSAVRVNALAHDPQSAQQRVAEGFRVLKIKVGVTDVREDVQRVQAIRRAVGDTITLRLDANCAWSMQDAQNAVEAFNPSRISLLEEPLRAEDSTALAALRVQSPIPLAADENARDEASIRRLLDEEAVDAIVLKPMLVGGPLQALRLARIAKQRGVYTLLTTSLDGPIATRMTAEVAARLSDDRAHGLGTGMLFDEHADFPQIVRGAMTLGGAT